MKSRKPGKKNNITVVFNSDDGVDDALAQLLLLSQEDKITIAGMVPTVGNAILGQTEINVRRILELVSRKNIPVYKGAETPLGLEKNVSEVNAAINETHFYGHDGLSDLPPESWPPITIPVQKENGYEFIANLVMKANPENPITLVSTASLTEIYKTLCRLEELCEASTLPKGCFADRLNIVAMGGIVDLAYGPNAPFDRPDYHNKTCTPKNPPCKDAEANFYWDTPATKGVFEKCMKYDIRIQLIPLDLTQQPGLLWTKMQVAALRNIPNHVASQTADMTDVVPWIDAKHFPKSTYPWHDGLTAAWILWGEEIFTKAPVSITIGDHGETLLNTNVFGKPNVDLIGIHSNMTALCMKRVIELFKNFNTISLPQETKREEYSRTDFIHDTYLEASHGSHLEIPQLWRSVVNVINMPIDFAKEFMSFLSNPVEYSKNLLDECPMYFTSSNVNKIHGENRNLFFATQTNISMYENIPSYSLSQLGK